MIHINVVLSIYTVKLSDFEFHTVQFVKKK